ncbi:hypothetical protein D3C78_1901500 [compost metagenome]
MLEINAWKMLGPVKHGDTIYMLSKVIRKTPSSKQDRGVITFERRCINQHGAVVQQMEATLLYRRRAA